MKKRVLSGIRATGRLHLGNYLGAVKGMLELQDHSDYETLYMIADIHTITTPYNVEELRKNRIEVVLDYLAAGLDPEKSIIFEQSDSLHAELAFYLSSVVTVARMLHLPTYKDKVKQYPEHSTMALLNYPVLMAADILIYKASVVPVGIDQEPHLEVAREIARKMNDVYGMDFPEPQRFATKGEYVPSLTGEGKMSKSVEGSAIFLTDDLNTIRAKVAKIPTDIGKAPIVSAKTEQDYNSRTEGPHFGLKPFVELFLGEEKAEEIKKLYLTTGIHYKNLKDEISEAIYRELKPIQEKREELSKNSEYIGKVLKDGSKKARAIAEKTVLEVREKMGLVYYG